MKTAITAELRWFERGTLPEEILHWFHQEDLGGKLGAPEEREDLYLYSPKCEYLGIKLRQGRLEIKWRQAELGVLSFGDRIEGQAEKWGKWLCEDPTSQSFQPASVLGKPWVNVKKVRWQRQYQVSPGESIIAIPATEAQAHGCSVELTQLDINGDAWWSLAFEAFGSDNYLIAELQAVASWMFKSYRGSKLSAQDSFAYPRWLSLVILDGVI